MKKMLLATALALLLQDVLNDVYCSKQTGSSSTKGKPSPIISSFLELGRRKQVDAKFVAAQKTRKQNRNPNIRKWIARFYYFRHLYSAGSACIAQYLHERSIMRAPLSALLINILLVPSSCFCIVISPLSEGEIILFSARQSGRLHYPRRRRWWLHALTSMTVFTCNRRRPAATSSRRASFSALVPATSSYFASSAATSR